MNFLSAWAYRPRFGTKIASRAMAVCLLPGFVLSSTLFPSAAAVAAEISGTLTLSGRQSNKARPRDAVVSFVPSKPARSSPDDNVANITTLRKDFSPKVLAVPVGTTVNFPNQDTILHNVFSASRPNQFDLGIYGQGEGKSKTFEQPGVVRIYCNVHPQMVAHILVVDSEFSVHPDDDGRFSLDGLPNGSGTLTIWHERAEPLTREVTLPLDGPIALDLPLTRSRLPPHLNKFGKPYKSRRGRRY